MFGLFAAWTLILSSFPASVFAQEKKTATTAAQIYVDGAAIYEKPDFDAKVQDYLKYQTKVIVAKKPVKGMSGMGLFHKVKYGNKIGYVPDTDIRVTLPETVKVAAPEKATGSKAWEKEEKEAMGKAPLYFTRYLGGAFAIVNFTEKFSGKKYSDDMMMYGLRMTGPGTLFDGPPLDFNFWFSLDKPDYYRKFAAGTPTGFLLFGDVMAMLPMIDTKNWLVTYGLGMMWTYTRYKVPVRRATTGVVSTFDSQEFRIGLDADFGVGRRFGKYLLRVDAKYYYEKSAYLGYIMSFQGEY